MMLPAAVAVGIALVTALALLARQRQLRLQRVEAGRADAARVVARARREAAASRRKAEGQARAEALEIRSRADDDHGRRAAELARREERVAGGEDTLSEVSAELDAREAELRSREQSIAATRERADELRRRARDRRGEARRALEERAETSTDRVVESLGQTWLDGARADAAQRLRASDQSPADPAVARAAQRVMNIAVSRYQNHFLTERSLSNIPISERCAELIGGGAVLDALEEVCNISLKLSDTGGSVRLEGLDGVGREVARRALSRLSKKPEAVSDASADPRGWAQAIRDQLEREIVGLGRKAFSVLKIQRAHPEIVTLVGALNYRTSYTQNQWLHAVEASFLAGMMADELGLDIRLARRATLLHDIGKALTHQIDGSHAVIGADIARRLGEDEIVANAVGAHHDDEPPNSIYAHLVKAADAMSGARPGARRELGELYSSRLEDLERIGRGYRGVERAFAVHGGRELRVYVREGEMSDLEAVELSGEIAEQIADELVFPGQIKVTVIRAYEAVAVAS